MPSIPRRSRKRSAFACRQAKKNVEAYSEAVDETYVEHAPQEDAITQLERLGALKAQGILTEEEFEMQKAKLLGT
jgi:hypothetical protein